MMSDVFMDHIPVAAPVLVSFVTLALRVASCPSLPILTCFNFW